MSRALALATVLVAGCGGPTVPAPKPSAPTAPAAPAAPVVAEEEAWWEEDPTGIDWATVSYGSDAEALALWERLGLDGENFEYRLDFVPEQPPELREAMAKGLLREGNFACPANAKPLTCSKNLLSFPELGPEHRLGDPCLRRELALWALGELDDDVLSGELAADLIALAGLPPPEEEINRAALYRVTDGTLRLQMLAAAEAAGNETIADENLGDLSQSGLETAAVQHHVDGAVLALGVDGALSLYIQSLADPALRPATRMHVAWSLGEYGAELDPADPNLPLVTAALERARVASDCTIAAAALDALEMISGRSYRPSLGKGAKQDAYARSLCLALHRGAGDTELAALLDQIAPKGVVLEERFRDPGRIRQLWVEYPDEPDDNRDGVPDVPEADPDGDGDGSTWNEIQRVPREAMVEIPIWEELSRALPNCKSAECQLPDQQVWFRLRWKKGPKGRLLLEKIERREIIGTCDQ